MYFFTEDMQLCQVTSLAVIQQWIFRHISRQGQEKLAAIWLEFSQTKTTQDSKFVSFKTTRYFNTDEKDAYEVNMPGTGVF